MTSAIVASTRTYNVGSPQGTFGQTVPSNQDLVNLFSSQSFVTGARNDGRFRSNLGIANFSLESVTVHFRIMMGVAQILVLDQPSCSPHCGQQRILGVGLGRLRESVRVKMPGLYSLGSVSF